MVFQNRQVAEDAALEVSLSCIIVAVSELHTGLFKKAQIVDQLEIAEVDPDTVEEAPGEAESLAERKLEFPAL